MKEGSIKLGAAPNDGGVLGDVFDNDASAPEAMPMARWSVAM